MSFIVLTKYSPADVFNNRYGSLRISLFLPKQNEMRYAGLPFPKLAQGIGRFASVSQGHKRTPGGDPRTETFHQMRVTADETCSVKGVSVTCGNDGR